MVYFINCLLISDFEGTIYLSQVNLKLNEHILLSFYELRKNNWSNTLSYLISFEVSRRRPPNLIDRVRILLFLGQQPFGQLKAFATSANLK